MPFGNIAVDGSVTGSMVCSCRNDRLSFFCDHRTQQRKALPALFANVRQALELLAEARSAGLPPNIVAFTTAVEACATAGKFSSVLSLLDQMSSEGIEPSVVTFSSALK